MAGTPSQGHRVLYVTYDGLLEPLGSSQVLPYVRGLAQAGYDMTVLSFEKPSDLAHGDSVAHLENELWGLGVGWTRLTYHRRPTVPATAYDVFQAVRLIRRFKPSLVHARSYIPALMASKGTKGNGGKLLFDMRGFWIDERIEAQGWKEAGLKVRHGRRVEARVLNRADHIVHLTHAARARVSARFSTIPLDRQSVIPTSADLERFRVPKDVAAVRRDLGIGAAGPLLVHSGTLGVRYQAERTVEIAKAFIKNAGGAFLVLTKELQEVSALTEAAGVAATIRSVEYPQVPLWLSAADAGLAMVRIGRSTAASAPTKVGEYLATGLAVAASACGDLTGQFALAEHSFVADEDEAPVETANRLARAARGVEREVESRALAERYYSLDKAVDGFAHVYERLGVRSCA